MTVDGTTGPASADSAAGRATTPTAVGQFDSGRATAKFLPTLRKALQSHPTRSDAEMVLDYRALRAAIGLIAFFLVPVVYVGNWLLFTRHVGGCFLPNPRLPASLSGYYYTHMRNLFVGAMSAMGIFLAAYRGHDRWDSRLTNVAGLAAICIALCPTMPPSYAPNGTNQFFTSANACGPSTPITYQQSSSQRIFGYVHLSSLAVLFAMVFLMVLVQFTRTTDADGNGRGDPAGGLREWWRSLFSQGIRAWWRSLFPAEPAKSRKRRRNRIYVFCAAGIALSGLLAVVTAIWPSTGSVAPLLLFAECGAFVFFGIAWYVKGAASVPLDHPQMFVWALSRTVRRWLADDTASEPVGGPEPAAAGRV